MLLDKLGNDWSAFTVRPEKSRYQTGKYIDTKQRVHRYEAEYIDTKQSTQIPSKADDSKSTWCFTDNFL